MTKRVSERVKIIAQIEAEMSLREMVGSGEAFGPGLKAAIAIIDPVYFKNTYLTQAKDSALQGGK